MARPNPQDTFSTIPTWVKELERYGLVATPKVVPCVPPPVLLCLDCVTMMRPLCLDMLTRALGCSQVLVGNKTDATRKVDREKGLPCCAIDPSWVVAPCSDKALPPHPGEALAKTMNALYAETSAKQGIEVATPFILVAREILARPAQCVLPACRHGPAFSHTHIFTPLQHHTHHHPRTFRLLSLWLAQEGGHVCRRPSVAKPRLNTLAMVSGQREVSAFKLDNRAREKARGSCCAS
jgi:hypothetical protein